MSIKKAEKWQWSHWKHQREIVSVFQRIGKRTLHRVTTPKHATRYIRRFGGELKTVQIYGMYGTYDFKALTLGNRKEVIVVDTHPPADRFIESKRPEFK